MNKCARTYSDRFEEALWVTLACSCESCGKVLEAAHTPELEDLMETDTLSWAAAVAPIAIGAGWSVSMQGNLICANCSEGLAE